VVNEHESAAHSDSPDGGTGKTCLGRGMHCPSASSLVMEYTSVASLGPIYAPDWVRNFVKDNVKWGVIFDTFLHVLLETTALCFV